MIWLEVEDSYFYEEENSYKLLREKIAFSNKDLAFYLDEKIDNDKIDFKLVFDKEDAKNIFHSKNNKKEQVIISPFNPKSLGIETSFFGVFRVENTEGILTSSEFLVGIKKQTKLNKKLGLHVEKSQFNFSNSNQDERLIEVAKYLTLKYMTGETPKSVFLSGVMGTGKSYFAQCLAGETDRLLISFNLANIMNEPNPLKAFDDAVDYLVNNPDEKYLLWIDEIDKIFNGTPESEHIKNKFLTFLNDLGMSIHIDTFVVMTANKVEDILKKFPEMLRAGRVEPLAKIFLDMIGVEEAKKTANLYINKRNSKENKLNVIANTIAWLNSGNTIFMEEFKNLNFFSLILSKLEDIKEIDTNTSKYKLTKNEKINLFKEKISFLFTQEELVELYDLLELKVSARKIIEYIHRNYKDVHETSRITAFFYVNAEIKEIVTQMYFGHLYKGFSSDEDDKVEKELNSIIKNNIAIVDASFDNYTKMVGNKKSFSIVVGQNGNENTN